MSTNRTDVRRLAQRGSNDRNAAYEILDAAMVAHVGIVDEGFPVVIPMLCARDGDHVLLHGSSKSRLMRNLAEGCNACVTVTLIDSLVLARSAFNHSANYRSLVVFGHARALRKLEEKRAALEKFVDHLVPGRSADARPGNAGELKATLIVAMPIDEFSVKARRGPPEDKKTDMDLQVWAGEMPVQTQFGSPIPAPEMPDDADVPDYIKAMIPDR